MKKLVLIASVLFTMSFVSCGISDATKNTNDSIDSTAIDSTIVDSTIVDSIVVDSTILDSTETK